MNMKKRYPTYMAAGAFVLFGVLVFLPGILGIFIPLQIGIAIHRK